MRVLLRLTLFVVVTMALSASADEDGSKRESLLRQLKALPVSAALFGQVKHLVLRLVTIDPVRAYKYYRIGMRRLLSDGKLITDAYKLEKKAGKIVGRSDLTDVQSRNALKRLASEAIAIADSAYVLDSTPTPTPTPAHNPTRSPTP